MKQLKLYLGVLAMFAMLFTSCSKEETGATPGENANDSATLQFGAVLNDLANKAMNTKAHFDAIPDCSDAEPAVAVVEFSFGETTRTVTVDIMEDEQGYFTAYDEMFKVPVGDEPTEVTLHSFMVYDGATEGEGPFFDDENGNLIWLAPSEEGNPGLFDGYVDEALPKIFMVDAGTKPYIDVEVLCFDRRMVNEYGYPFFDISPKELYPLCFFANYCTDSGRHYVGNYSVSVWYNDGEGEPIQLYTDSTPMTGMTGGEYSADPLCLVVPESPFDDPDMDYITYQVTPRSWADSYGTIDEEPMMEVHLSWTDIKALLDEDGNDETTDYIHIFINCGDNPGGGDCTPSEGDMNGDCIPDDQQCDMYPELCPDDDCLIDSDGDGVPNCEDACDDDAGPAENNGCPTGDDCTVDTDGDGTPDCYDECDGVAGPVDNNGCPNDYGNCETAFMYGNNDDLEFRDLDNAPGRWGWVAMGAGTYTIYAAAGNNYKMDMPVGTATVTTDGEEISLTIDWADGYGFTELHVDVFASEPNGNDVKAPGQYTYNYSGNDLMDGHTYTLADPAGEGFYIVVHAQSCEEID